jgi:hypothetical protein
MFNKEEGEGIAQDLRTGSIKSSGDWPYIQLLNVFEHIPITIFYII